MKLNFSAEICQLNGQPIKDGDANVTLATAASHALLAQYPDEQHLAGDEKARRFKLAMQIVGGGEQDLKVEEVAEIKKLIGKAYAPLIVGRAYEIIDTDGQ